MRCPSCETFVSYDTDVEPEEVEEPTVEGTTFTATYRRVLACIECGEELKEHTFELEVELTDLRMVGEGEAVYRDATEDEVQAHEDEEDEPEWEMDDVTVSPTTAAQTVDGRGKKITSARYMKTLYGVEVSGTAKCKHCGIIAAIRVSDDVAASAMDELV